MTKYKFKGYTITNCGYHQPDHCVWWEAVDANGEACFHGNTLREVEFLILEHEWEQKVRGKDEEIEKLKSMSVGNAAAMREALQEIHNRVNSLDEECGVDPIEVRDIARDALAKPARNCDVYDSYGDAIRAFEDAEDAEDYEEMAEWLLAPATEQKGGNDGVQSAS